MTTHTAAATRIMPPGVGGWILPVSTGQVIVWQFAALAALAFPARGAVVAAAILVIGLTSVRIGGLHAQQWAVTYARYRLGRTTIGPVATPIWALLPRLHVHTHVDRAGNRVGIANVDDVDYSVVLRIEPLAHPNAATLISLLRNAFDRADLPMHGAQLVAWTVPANPVPITIHWLALRYRHDDTPLPALARGGGPDGARRTVASAALRLSAELSAAGYANSVLDTPELHQELVVAVGGGGATHWIAEGWHDWSIGGVRQACFLPRRAADAVNLTGRHIPGSTFTCVSHTLSRTTAGTVRTSATVRIGLPRNEPRLSPRAFAARLRPRLAPANGRHRRHVLATLPLART